MNNLLDLNSSVVHLEQNLLGRDFVAGDLHGCIHQLELLLEEVNFDYSMDRLILVGDLVDRGLYSKKTLELLKQSWVFSVLGNHEDLTRGSMVKFLKDNNAYDGLLVGSQGVEELQECHMNNGGEWLQKYLAEKGSLEEKIAYCKEMVDILNKLPLVLTVGEGANRYNVVHSEILLWADVATDDKLDNHIEQFIKNDFIWARQLFVYNKRNAIAHAENFQNADLSITYSGHTPVRMITKIARQINLDTCAYYADFISKDTNGSQGLTIVNPADFNVWTINGASHEIKKANLQNEYYKFYLGDLNE